MALRSLIQSAWNEASHNEVLMSRVCEKITGMRKSVRKKKFEQLRLSDKCDIFRVTD